MPTINLRQPGEIEIRDIDDGQQANSSSQCGDVEDVRRGLIGILSAIVFIRPVCGPCQWTEAVSRWLAVGTVPLFSPCDAHTRERRMASTHRCVLRSSRV